jgi:hypothetical protein
VCACYVFLVPPDVFYVVLLAPARGLALTASLSLSERVSLHTEARNYSAFTFIYFYFSFFLQGDPAVAAASSYAEQRFAPPAY